MHKSITEDRLIAAITEAQQFLTSPGFCKACGEEHDQVEPDARNYPCDSCDERQVFGAEELLMEMA